LCEVIQLCLDFFPSSTPGGNHDGILNTPHWGCGHPGGSNKPGVTKKKRNTDFCRPYQECPGIGYNTLSGNNSVKTASS
jgi:hypothetical protein